MKTIFIGGNHPRHLYILNVLSNSSNLVGAVIHERGSLLPRTPVGLLPLDKKNFIRHFKERQLAEIKYFSADSIPNIPIKNVNDKNLNSRETAKFVSSLKPDLVIVFGSNLIKDPLARILPKCTVNIHLGLSPRYRGSATLFWPFYFLEPTYAGSTFHLIISEPDAGDIIHQAVPELSSIDGIHDVACKTVIKSAEELRVLLKIFQKNNSFILYKQKGTGKKFLTTDFRPEHLRVIYNLFDNNIVEKYLTGNIKCKKPKLIKQF